MTASTIGTSLLLLAIGAILAFAVSARVSGVAIPTVGVILMVVGAIGLLFGIFAQMSLMPWGHTHERDPHDDYVDHYR